VNRSDIFVEPVRIANVDIIFIANKNPLYSTSIFVGESHETNICIIDGIKSCIGYLWKDCMEGTIIIKTSTFELVFEKAFKIFKEII
jgi:hypothetical protein